MTTNSVKRRIAVGALALALAVTGGGVAAAAGSGTELEGADVARGGSGTVERAPQPGSASTQVPAPR